LQDENQDSNASTLEAHSFDGTSSCSTSLTSTVAHINDSVDPVETPLQSGIRIKSDGRYEVFVDGKLFEDKSTRAASSKQSSNSEVRPLQEFTNRLKFVTLVIYFPGIDN
jgi:hypothetical protein